MALDANDLNGNDVLLDGNTDSVFIITSIPNSINPVEETVGLTIYPNPVTNSHFYIYTENNEGVTATAVQLISTDGRIIAAQTFDTQNRAGSQKVELTDVASGIYMARITLSNGLTVAKKICVTKI